MLLNKHYYIEYLYYHSGHCIKYVSGRCMLRLLWKDGEKKFICKATETIKWQVTKSGPYLIDVINITLKTCLTLKQSSGLSIFCSTISSVASLNAAAYM